MPAMMRSQSSLASPVVVILSIMIVTLAGCSTRRHREHVQQTLGQVDKAVVLAEARRVWQQHRSMFGEELPPAEWPQVFRQFDPEKVIVDTSGVFVCTHSLFVRDAGLFIALDPAFQPYGKTDPIYEHLGGPFYWYDANG